MVTGAGAPTAANLSAFRGARVFVTGDTGFKGSWLSLWLTELGADVSGYALPPAYADSHFDLLGLDKIIHHIDGDIRDGERLQKAMQAAKPDFVFHLAAQALVRQSYADPVNTFSTNVVGSACLLEACRNVESIRSLVYATSDKCYLNKEWVWSYRESDELGGLDPYSASKAAAENVFLAYHHSFLRHRTGLGAATTRAGNVIGGGDWAADRLVPDCIRALKTENPIVLRNLAATRPWQFVLEPVGGYMMLALRLKEAPGRYAGSWNFGPHPMNVRTVEQVTNQIIGAWGSGSHRHEPPATIQHEANLLQLSIDKAGSMLGWQPVYSVAQCVGETVSWYRAHHDGANIPEFSRTQLKNYMAAAAS